MGLGFRLSIILDTAEEGYVINNVSKSSTVRDLKEKFEFVSGLPSYLIELFYLDECSLVDSKALGHYHILPESKLKARVWRWSIKLVTAAMEGDVSTVHQQIHWQSSPGKSDAPNDTLMMDKALCALFIGCFHGHDELVNQLLQLGVKYRKPLPSGVDAIQIATSRGNIKCIELLLRRKIRPHEWNNDRMSLTNWYLQDRIKSTLDRIGKTTKIENNVLYTRLTNSQKYDSALSTWYNGHYGQIYACEILDGSKVNDRDTTKPVFLP